MKIKLNSHSVSTVIEHTYGFVVDKKEIIYKEFLNDKNKVIDAELRNQNGEDINDPILLEKVQEFVDNLENK